jgi:hypothetical protein
MSSDKCGDILDVVGAGPPGGHNLRPPNNNVFRGFAPFQREMTAPNKIRSLECTVTLQKHLEDWEDCLDKYGRVLDR